MIEQFFQNAILQTVECTHAVGIGRADVKASIRTNLAVVKTSALDLDRLMRKNFFSLFVHAIDTVLHSKEQISVFAKRHTADLLTNVDFLNFIGRIVHLENTFA